MTTVPLGTLVEDITVGWVGPMAGEYVPTGIPFLRTLNVQPYAISTDDLKYITPEFHRRISKSALRPGDVVIARTGRPGTASVVPDWLEDANCSDLVVIRPGKGMDARFLVYFLNSKTGQDLVHARKVGSVQSHFNIGAAKKLPFPPTPLDEQRRIAAVLGALDDKIEANRKMNRTLEEMAQAIFKSWFIDFDGHDDLVDSEIGPVPRGWEVGSPDAFVEFDPTIPLRKGTEAIYADMKAIPTSGPAVSEWTRRAYAGGTRFQQGDTLLARITPCLENGKSALVDFLADGEVAFGSTEFIVLRPRPGVPRVWPYCLVRHEPFRAHAIANMTGSSGRQRVSAGALLGFQLAVPPAEVLRRFGVVSDPLFERITANTRESTTLASLRDALLPKLISGALRVPEAEEAVGAASPPQSQYAAGEAAVP